MQTKHLLTGAVIFIGLIVFHLVAFVLILGTLPLLYFYKILINFGTGAVISIPVCWLFFYRIYNYNRWRKLIIHVLVFCLYLPCWYYIQDFLHHIAGLASGSGNRLGLYWDLYFASLYYAIIFGLLHAYNFIIRRKVIKAREHELLVMAQSSEISALKAQIHPHFLFNTLNTIVASLPPQNEAARTLITLLGDTFRYSMKASLSEYVALSEEIDFIQAILKLEKERLGSRLDYCLEVEESCRSLIIAPLIIQPLVENALEHGINPSPGGGEIKVRIFRLKNTLHVNVSNTGVRYRGSISSLFNTGGVGLDNLNRRLWTLYGSGLTVSKKEQGGLAFVYNIPVL